MSVGITEQNFFGTQIECLNEPDKLSAATLNRDGGIILLHYSGRKKTINFPLNG